MTEQQFRQLVLERGYGDIQAKDYLPHTDGALHAHEFSVMLLITGGEFSLAFADGVAHYRPGELCELAVNVMHTERAGSTGASVLLAKRAAAA